MDDSTIETVLSRLVSNYDFHHAVFRWNAQRAFKNLKLL